MLHPSEKGHIIVTSLIWLSYEMSKNICSDFTLLTKQMTPRVPNATLEFLFVCKTNLNDVFHLFIIPAKILASHV